MKTKPVASRMLKSLRLKNFKAYRDSGEIPLAPLTVIVGCNNAGKSTLLQALFSLSQTIKDPSYTARLVTGGEVELGSFYDIVHKQKQSQSQVVTIEVSRDIDHKMPAPPEAKFRESTRLKLSLSFNRKANRIQVRNLDLSDDKGLILNVKENGSWSYEGVPQNVSKHITVGLRNFLPKAFLQDEPKHKPSEKMTAKVVDALMSIDTQSHSWVHVFYNIDRIPPHRSHVPYYGGIGEREPAKPGRGEALIRILASDDKLGHSDDTLLQAVKHWMNRFGVLADLRLKHLDDAGHVRCLIADVHSGGAQGINIAAMGEGISQLLPIISTVIRGGPYNCLLIEQPEVHLHPKLQADLADLFIDVVKRGKRQIIVETHSEHLLLRLRRRIAEGEISASEVSILYVEQTHGEAHVRQLALDGKGQMDDWPENFFDEGYKEALALAKASSKA